MLGAGHARCVIMSSAVETESDAMQRCASCGTAENDDIKLKKCTACHLVRYCSVKCQKEHWSQHKKECKKLRDEILFKQPESSHLGDCPICCLPLPIDPSKSAFYTCCSKHICQGCHLVNQKRERDQRLQCKCPFCRKALPKTMDESKKRLMKRIEVNDPVAMRNMGAFREMEGDYKAAFDYWTRAAAWGDAMAHYQLAGRYRKGLGVVEKDEKRALHHVEQAAIGGHPGARHNLGCMEERHGRIDRAVKHWIIATKLGYDESLNAVTDLYKAGLVKKEDFTAALRGYQAAINATKSPHREEVEKRRRA